MVAAPAPVGAHDASAGVAMPTPPSVLAAAPSMDMIGGELDDDAIFGMLSGAPTCISPTPTASPPSAISPAPTPVAPDSLIGGAEMDDDDMFAALLSAPPPLPPPHAVAPPVEVSAEMHDGLEPSTPVAIDVDVDIDVSHDPAGEDESKEMEMEEDADELFVPPVPMFEDLAAELDDAALELKAELEVAVLMEESAKADLPPLSTPPPPAPAAGGEAAGEDTELKLFVHSPSGASTYQPVHASAAQDASHFQYLQGDIVLSTGYQCVARKKRCSYLQVIGVIYRLSVCSYQCAAFLKSVPELLRALRSWCSLAIQVGAKQTYPFFFLQPLRFRLRRLLTTRWRVYRSGEDH